MTATSIATGLVAREYAALGWVMTPFMRGTKGPVRKNWGVREKCVVPEDWVGNFGLVHGYSKTCAVDIDNLDEARKIIDIDALMAAPDAVWIIGNPAGHAKLLYKVPVPMVSVKWRVEHRDVLNFRCMPADMGRGPLGCSVQDVLPPSLHPDTGGLYQWGGAGDYRRLPMLPLTVMALWSEKLRVDRPTGSGAGGGRVVDPEDLERRRAETDVDELTAALHVLDPDTDRETWVRIGMAYHSGGGEYEDWDAWSATGSKYAGPQDTEERWRSFKGDGGVQKETLLWMAYKVGWKAPIRWRFEDAGEPPAVPAARVDGGVGGGAGSGAQDARVELSMDDVQKMIGALAADATSKEIRPVIEEIAYSITDPLDEEHLLSLVKDRTTRTLGALKKTLDKVKAKMPRVSDSGETEVEYAPTGNSEIDKMFTRVDSHASVVSEVSKMLRKTSGSPDKDSVAIIAACNAEVIFNKGCGTIYPQIRFNDFKREPEFASQCGERRYEAKDALYTKLRNCISRDFSVEFSIQEVIGQADLMAQSNVFHPVKEYLLCLKWDGVPRINTWMTRLLGVEDSERTRSISGTLLCGAAQRILRPGSKYDYMVILEGSQGINKSTFIRALVPDPSWFTDEGFNTRNMETTVDNIQGKWIIEVGELKGMGSHDVEVIKQFITRTEDRFRAKYTRASRDWPRQCIFIGTKNPNQDGEYLDDSTGNRRHMPVTCKMADVAGLELERDQLWAEAAAMVASGRDAFSLYPYIEVLNKEEQERRRSKDAWEEPIDIFLGTRNTVHTSEIYALLGFHEVKEVGKGQKSRVASIMNAFGSEWEYNEKTVVEGKGRHRGYQRKIKIDIPEAEQKNYAAPVFTNVVEFPRQGEKTG